MINITDQEFNNILSGITCTFLHNEDIDKMYNACSTFKTMIDDDWKIIYHDCLHHQPHNPGEYDEPVIDKYGNQRWYREGFVHRDGDQPAVIGASGNQYWFKEGKCHRDGDLPAVIWASGYQAWYREGNVIETGTNRL